MYLYFTIIYKPKWSVIKPWSRSPSKMWAKNHKW